MFAQEKLRENTLSQNCNIYKYFSGVDADGMDMDEWTRIVEEAMEVRKQATRIRAKKTQAVECRKQNKEITQGSSRRLYSIKCFWLNKVLLMIEQKL